MNRLIGLIALIIIFPGSVAFFQYKMTNEIKPALAAPHEEPKEDLSAAKSYTVKVTCGYNAAKDPFALNLDNTVDKPRIELLMGEKVLLKHTKDITRGDIITVDDVKLTAKEVSFLVKSTPNLEDAGFPCPLRIELYLDTAICDTKTVWSSGGGVNISETITLNTSPILQTLNRGLGGE